MKGRKKRVVLGISGSASGKVAAALLKNQDYDVKCVFLELKTPFGKPNPYFYQPESEAGELEKFCRKLDIDLITVDVTAEFEAKVIDPAIHARLSGAVVDTHLLWVSEVLLAHLERVRREIKADLVATGHRIQMTVEATSGQAAITLGQEWERDECALISRADPEILKHAFFPIGEIPPAMVKKLSQELGIVGRESEEESPPALTPFQWDLIPSSIWSSEWLASRAAEGFLVGGPIRTADQMGLGEHEGLHRYRIGERSPIDSAARITDLQIKGPVRALITGTPAELARSAFILEQMRFVIGTDSLREEEFTLLTGPVTQKTTARTTIYTGGFLAIECDPPLQAISPGQTAVFFKGNHWVGSALFTATRVKKRISVTLESPLPPG